jgi:mannose-1-phosphate guanylyltransferase
MLESGEYSWNSGMFIWRADRILGEFERQMPDFFAQLNEVRGVLGTPDYASVLERVWPLVANQSIDYGIMEGARQAIVIPTEIGWTDIGSWGSLFELLPRDDANNVSVGSHLGIDTQNTLVFGGKRLIATMGVTDLMVIDTDDALLVCSRSREQDVKAIVEQLKLEEYNCLV